LCTVQCFLLKGLLKHFMCFCGRFFRDGNKISSRFAVRYGQTLRFRKRSLTTLGRIDNTNLYNILWWRPLGYWFVKGAITLAQRGNTQLLLGRASRSQSGFFWVDRFKYHFYLWTVRVSPEQCGNFNCVQGNTDTGIVRPFTSTF